MKGLIFDTKENALAAGQQDALAQFESDYGVLVDNSKVPDSAFITRSYSTNCTCGETGAIGVILFASDITPAMTMKANRSPKLSAEEMEEKNQQYRSGFGYCEYCGTEHPMS